MKILTVIFLVGLLISGCASTPQLNEEIPWQQIKAEIPVGKGLICVIRPFDHAASLKKYSISINGVHVADMRTGTYFCYQVPSGEVRISAETTPTTPTIFDLGLAKVFMGKPELNLKTRTEEVLFVNVEVAFSGGPKLASIESALGERLAKESSKIEVTVQPTITGSSASGVLLDNTTQMVLMIDSARLPSCKESRHITVEQASFDKPGSYAERWQVERCGTSKSYRITYTPTPSKGGTDFSVQEE